MCVRCSIDAQSANMTEKEKKSLRDARHGVQRRPPTPVYWSQSKEAKA